MFKYIVLILLTVTVAQAHPIDFAPPMNLDAGGLYSEGNVKFDSVSGLPMHGSFLYAYRCTKMHWLNGKLTYDVYIDLERIKFNNMPVVSLLKLKTVMDSTGQILRTEVIYSDQTPLSKLTITLIPEILCAFTLPEEGQNLWGYADNFPIKNDTKPALIGTTQIESGTTSEMKFSNDYSYWFPSSYLEDIFTNVTIDNVNMHLMSTYTIDLDKEHIKWGNFTAKVKMIVDGEKTTTMLNGKIVNVYSEN